jgi:hypothetical protein
LKNVIDVEVENKFLS